MVSIMKKFEIHWRDFNFPLVHNEIWVNAIHLWTKLFGLPFTTFGITSHAAIVARELKKPCVIGTKIATKIFKDGDLVEVDANKGIVRKV